MPSTNRFLSSPDRKRMKKRRNAKKRETSDCGGRERLWSRGRLKQCFPTALSLKTEISTFTGTMSRPAVKHFNLAQCWDENCLERQSRATEHSYRELSANNALRSFNSRKFGNSSFVSSESQELKIWARNSMWTPSWPSSCTWTKFLNCKRRM